MLSRFPGPTWAAAFAAATLCVSPARADVAVDEQTRRVRVETQVRDDDCGPAALVTLMRMAGVEISESALLTGLAVNTDRRREGLTALDLRRMVERSGTGLSLAGEFVGEDRLNQMVQQRPVIVLLYEFGERRNGATPAIGHFVVLEAWSQARGFLVADPALGRRGFMSLGEVSQQAHPRSGERSHEILVMYLERDGPIAAHAGLVTSDEERRYGDLRDLRRLATGLPRGKTLVTLAVSHARSRLRIGGDAPLELSTSDSTATFIVQHGLDNRTTLNWSLGLSRSGAALRFSGTPGFSLGSHDVATPMQVALSRRVDLGLPENVSTELSVGAAFRDVVRPIGLNAGIAGQLQLGRTSVIGAANVSVTRVGGETFADANSSIGVSRSIAHGFDLGTTLSLNVPMRSSAPYGELTVSLGRPIGRNWLVEAYVSRIIGPSGGLRSSQVGLSLTVAVPNRLR